MELSPVPGPATWWTWWRRRLPGPGRLLVLAIVGGFVIWTLGPLYWMVATSFKGVLEATSLEPTLWPSRPTVENYVGLVTGNFPFTRFVINSTLTSLASAILTTVLATLAAYSFSRGRYLLRSPLMYVVLATQMLPLAVLLVPLYRAFSEGGPAQHVPGGWSSATAPSRFRSGPG